MRPAATALPLMVVIMIFAGSISSAQETTGDIRGRVRNAAGQAVAGVRVTVTSTGLQGGRRTVTASDGVFQILRLPPASYNVAITAIGFAPVRIDSVRVQLGRT